ncbi:hypothetical protein Tco_0438187 [Tanacetum coccineum]
METSMVGGKAQEYTWGSTWGKFVRDKVKEIARAVTSKEDMTSQEILHRKAKRVEFKSAIIIPSKLTNKNEVFNNIRSDKNIVKVKRAMNRGNNAMSGVSNGNGITVTNMYRWE